MALENFVEFEKLISNSFWSLKAIENFVSDKSSDQYNRILFLKETLQCVATEIGVMNETGVFSISQDSFSKKIAIDYFYELLNTSKHDHLKLDLEQDIWDNLLQSLTSNSKDFTFILSHIITFIESFYEIVESLVAAFTKSELMQHLVSPKLKEYVLTQKDHSFGTLDQLLTFDELQEVSKRFDLFYSSDAFRYYNKKFLPTKLNKVKPIDKFYGFVNIRQRIGEYFQNFANGNLPNLPLLISGLPGLGKTQYILSHCKNFDNITLVLPEPEALESELEVIIDLLSKRKNHRYIIFFDDIDTDSINWFYFRTHVGGCFNLPENVTLVLSSNYDFPASVSSRGIGIEFPIFDETQCMEMVCDYIKSLGMKSPPNNLISVISSDYVEEFAQKMFEDLSPRTLARYLDNYDKSPEKRRLMLEMSRRELITKPDPQSFYDENIRIMKALYGEDGLEKMKAKVLGEG
jgi:predicted AAA+ superfamily ATPase